jgi:hypothetical protein
VFSDLDGVPLDPVMQIKFLPHIVNETSPRRWHAYWRVDDLPLDQFTAVQKGIAARFNGDPAVCDLPRVMRLPGFLHRKGVPYLVRIKTAHEQPAYPGAIFERSKTSRPQPNAELVADENRIACAVAFIPNDEMVDWKAWCDFGLAIFGATGGSDKGFVIFDAWSRRCPSQYNERDTRKAWARFKKSPPDRVGAGTIFYLASEVDPHWESAYDAELTAMLDDADRDPEIDRRMREELGMATVVPGDLTSAGIEDKAETKTEESKQEEWPIMDPAAYHGFAGEVVNTIVPHSEADPVALLLQLLVCFGNIIDRSRYYQVESNRHYTNIFVNLVGLSAKARKGTSFDRIRAVTKDVDPGWVDNRIQGGLSSGEGLINVVRDPTRKWDAESQTERETDHGVTDKRLLIIEPEFAGVLSIMERSGNTISSLIRKAWDGSKLQTMTRKEPLTATNAHISIIGHITEDELRSRLTRTDMANGFANRFLFALVKRSKELPFGGDLSDSEIQMLGEELKQIVGAVTDLFDQPPQKLTFTNAARAEWAKVYSALSAGRPGLLGAVTARAEAQVVRLALIYALLDRANQIDLVHLKAGLAVWKYCEASAARIFGRTLGDDVADTIERALIAAGASGLDRTTINNLFGRHQTSARISAALTLLLEHGRARAARQVTRGRPTEVWFAVKT